MFGLNGLFLFPVRTWRKGCLRHGQHGLYCAAEPLERCWTFVQFKIAVAHLLSRFENAAHISRAWQFLIGRHDV